MSTRTTAHPGSRRLQEISHQIQAIVDGNVYDVATYTIRVEGTAANPVVTAAPIRFADNPVAWTLQVEVAQPPVITRPVAEAL